ncbi:uncharacterized protein LOC111627777 [Centruroides sculpturatus]|uniref:uncharacterized protein LOC111627777 n=1 Tax=Centruroides sculpturatus TaxID=218467 RepID=UPI000C6D67DC|nr:uncharacterized protein LOC111627777 [Centruroides sculpturatus]
MKMATFSNMANMNAILFSFRNASSRLRNNSIYRISRTYIENPSRKSCDRLNSITNLKIPFCIHLPRRYLCLQKNLSEEEVKKNVDNLSEKFSEAIGLLEDARQSLGTVYFSEDMKEAEDTVSSVLNDYNNLLGKLHETQRINVNRTIGLKMHELKAQLQLIKEMCRE